MADNSAKSRAWIYTLNNYTDVDIDQFKGFTASAHKCAKEVGENGTPHLQGVIVFKNQCRLSALKKLNNRAHWEICRAEEQAWNYCSKGELIISLDTRKQGARTDLNAVAKSVKNGSNIKTIANDHPVEFIKFHSGIEKLISYQASPRNFKPEVIWIYGDTGSGKTRFVCETETDLWISGKNLKWWQGYENQEATLFDDFRGDFCTFHELLRILDRYPYTVEVKGGSRQLNSKRMYITSCYPPDKVYDTREDIQQLLRRIDSVRCLKSENQANPA